MIEIARSRAGCLCTVVSTEPYAVKEGGGGGGGSEEKSRYFAV